MALARWLISLWFCHFAGAPEWADNNV